MGPSTVLGAPGVLACPAATVAVFPPGLADSEAVDTWAPASCWPPIWMVPPSAYAPPQVPRWPSLNPRELFPRASTQGSQSRRSGWRACGLDKPRRAGSCQKEAREEQEWDVVLGDQVGWVSPGDSGNHKVVESRLRLWVCLLLGGDMPGWACSACAEGV